MALNFGLLDPNAPAAIANSVTQGQQMAQQEKLGQMRMESAQLDLDKVKREAAGLQRMQQLFMDNGKSPDMRMNFSEMIKSGIPHFMDIGYNGLKALDEQDRYQAFVRNGQPANAMAAPAAPAESIIRQPMAAAPTQNALGTGTYGMEPTAAPVNAMAARAPVATPAPVNAMATQDRAAQIQRRMAELSQFPNIAAAKSEMKVLEKELESTFKPHVVGGNLVGPSGNIIFTAPEKKSDFERELNAADLTEAQKIALRRQWLAKQATHAPGTSVYMPPQEKAEQGDRGKMLVKQYEGISETARLGARSLPALQANATILDKGFDTGFGTEAKAAGAKVLGALGVKDAEKYATDAQTFLGNASAAVLQKQLEQKGAQTEFDAQRITQTGAQLGNTKQANKFFIDIAREQIQRDIEQRNFYDKWWKTNKTYDGAEDAWYSGDGSKSLFERPALKKYTAPTKVNAGAATVDNRTATLDSIFKPK